MNDTQKDLIYLLGCAVNGIIPDEARVREMNPDELFGLAERHSVEGGGVRRA